MRGYAREGAFLQKGPLPRAPSRKGCFEGRRWGKGRFSRVYLKSQNEEENKNKDKIIRVEGSKKVSGMKVCRYKLTDKECE